MVYFWQLDGACPDASSVARGGLEPPHWFVKYAKSHVFGAFEVDFVWKIENSLPHRKTARLEGLNFRIWPKNRSQLRRRPFFFFFFWRPLDFGRKKTFEFLVGKNLWISDLSEKFCLNFRTNRVKLIQELWKFGSRSFALFSFFQNSPPPLFQILATRLPDASKFESFIPLVPLVFELELFKSKIGILFFGLETRMAWPIAPKICTKNDLYVPQLRCKFQGSTFQPFQSL